MIDSKPGYFIVFLTLLVVNNSTAQEASEIPPISPEMQARWAITDGPDDIYLRVYEPLDEWRYYCLDIPGSRDQLIGHQMNIHTCKEGMWHRDTIFSYERTAQGELYMPEYGLCIEANSYEPDATLHLQECAANDLQQWDFSDNRVRLAANSDLCLTVSPVAGELTSGGLAYPTGYMSREISLQSCSEQVSDRQQWIRAKPRLDLEVPILPDGSPADWRDWVNPN